MLLGLLSARCCLIYRGHAWSAVRSNLHATISRSSGSLVSGQPDAGPSTRGHVWSAVRSSLHATIRWSSTSMVSDQPDAAPSTRGHVCSAVRSSLRATISWSSTSMVSDQPDAAPSTRGHVSSAVRPPCHNQQVFKLCGLWSARRCPTYRCHLWSAVRSCFHATISRSSTPMVSDQPEAAPSIRGHVWSAVRSILCYTISRSSSSVVSGQLDAASSTETSVSDGAPYYGNQSAALTRGAALMDIKVALPPALGRES